MISALFVFLPLVLGMVAVAFLKDSSNPKKAAIFASAVAFILAILANYGSTVLPWFSVGSYTLNISIFVAPINYMLLLLVTLVGTLVMIYSSGYIVAPSEQRRFYLEILAFEISMALFSISGNFITLFIAWEFLSLTSYLLIGFWNARDSANRAARKALTIVLIGDIALLAAIVIFWNAFGTLEFTAIISAASAAPASAYAGVLLLLVAIFTKSAQFPFHEWLTDAMEGPTPVSAYLHSSTMVKAGVFVAILLFPLFQATGTLQIMLIFGIVTAIIATFGAMRETQIKKVIAYSTIQELSIMFIALGAGALIAAIYFFFVQTFYKALLFFSAGNVMEATEKDFLNEASGLKSNKLIYFTTLAGVLSLAGFIPFSGFFANVGIASALSANLPVYVILSIISLLTSFYIFRWLFYLSKKPTRPSLAGRYLTQPPSMVYTMVLLALLTIAASAFLLYISQFVGYGGYLPFLSNLSIGVDVTGGVIFLVLIIIGAALSYMFYGRGTSKTSAQNLDFLLYTKPITNFIYSLSATFAYEIGEGAGLLDTHISDISDSIGGFINHTGLFIRKASVGDINLYALIVILGVIALFATFYILVIS